MDPRGGTNPPLGTTNRAPIFERAGAGGGGSVSLPSEVELSTSDGRDHQDQALPGRQTSEHQGCLALKHPTWKWKIALGQAFPFRVLPINKPPDGGGTGPDPHPPHAKDVAVSDPDPQHHQVHNAKERGMHDAERRIASLLKLHFWICLECLSFGLSCCCSPPSARS